jgi:hypothetical protein
VLRPGLAAPRGEAPCLQLSAIRAGTVLAPVRGRRRCTSILKVFDEELALPGAFAAGEYTLRINALTRTFGVE